MSLVIVVVLVLLMAAVAVSLLLRAAERERHEDVNLRLRVLGGGEEAAQLAAQLAGSRQVNNPLLRFFCHLLWRSGSDLQVGTIQRGLIVIAVLIPLAWLVFGFLLGIAVMSFLLAIGWVLLMQQAVRRRRKIIDQLPAFLESAIRVLAAGNTLEEAIASSVREAPDPIRPLFASVGRQVRLGAPIETVLAEMAEIHQIRDLNIMALAASINRKYGGSLRNVLRSLIQAVRARENAARELRALTAETRFSAIVLAVIPIILMLFIVWQNPGYYAQMWSQGSGKLLLGGSVVMQVLGMLVIYRMMRNTSGDA